MKEYPNRDDSKSPPTPIGSPPALEISLEERFYQNIDIIQLGAMSQNRKELLWRLACSVTEREFNPKDKSELLRKIIKDVKLDNLTELSLAIKLERFLVKQLNISFEEKNIGR